MRVLVSGSHGLIGRALTAHLTKSGHQIVSLLRSSDTVADPPSMWEPIHRQTWQQNIGAVDAVVHLAGENLAAHRWNQKVKQRIWNSRVLGTEQLCQHLADLSERPRVLVAASAVGYYGDRGDEILTEDSAPGNGFLADLCRGWEKACVPASQAGIRVVNLRIGTVLAKEGGALAKLLPAYKLGLGGRLGSGKQWTSWIGLEDLVRVIEEALAKDRFVGPMNAVSPHPVTNTDYARTLGRVLRRPTAFPLPAGILRLALGEMAQSLLLSSARVEPRRLSEVGHRFLYPELEAALRSILTEN